MNFIKVLKNANTDDIKRGINERKQLIKEHCNKSKTKNNLENFFCVSFGDTKKLSQDIALMENELNNRLKIK